MSEKIDCEGFCWVKKDGVLVWRCDQTQCPCNEYFFNPSQPTVETCFT
jgi:hypothetical protein